MINKLKLLLRDAYTWDYTGVQAQDEGEDNGASMIMTKKMIFELFSFYMIIEFKKTEFDFSEKILGKNAPI